MTTIRATPQEILDAARLSCPEWAPEIHARLAAHLLDAGEDGATEGRDNVSDEKHGPEAVAYAIRLALNEWGSDFKAEVTASEYEDDGAEVFDVCLSNHHFPHKFYFFARINSDLVVEMDMNEEFWVELDKGNLFALMYFELASR